MGAEGAVGRSRCRLSPMLRNDDGHTQTEREREKRNRNAPLSSDNLLEHGDHADSLARRELLARLDDIERVETKDLGDSRNGPG